MFFLKGHTKHMVKKLVPDPFVNIKIETNLWILNLKCYKFVFILCPSQGPPKYVKSNVLTTCFNLIYSFLKSKKCLKPYNSPCLIFCMVFEEKYLSRYILLTDQFSLPDCLHFLRYRAVYVL